MEEELRPFGNELHEMMVQMMIVQDVGVPLDRERLTIACFIGACQESGLCDSESAGHMLDWLYGATEEDIKWLFDKNAGNR